MNLRAHAEARLQIRLNHTNRPKKIFTIRHVHISRPKNQWTQFNPLAAKPSYLSLIIQNWQLPIAHCALPKKKTIAIGIEIGIAIENQIPNRIKNLL
ncbi:hypothetical protein JXA32_04595 [Candidatus Sumerlaeota bacterium]|nr:hypothetical protein [Candidatus Sumerlaeota bacterium]